MQDHSTRRTFLATLGTAGTITIAGCSALPGSSNSTSKDNASPSPTSTPSQGDGTTTPATSTDTPTATPQKKPRYTRGKTVDDFEGDVSSRWHVDYGKYTVTHNEVYEGSQSLVLEPLKPSQRRNAITRPFTRISTYFGGSGPPLDLSGHDLTLAAKVEKPEDMDIEVQIHAPTESISLSASRYIPLELDDWVRFDLGYTGAHGNPKLDTVLALDIIIDTNPHNAKDFRVAIDSLRKIPKPKKGKVIFHFDDAHISAYENVYPLFKGKGWPGACAIIPNVIGADHRLTRQMMLEMSQNGWDMMSHGGHDKPLPLFPENVQRRKIVRSYQSLKALGFAKGARHFVAPYSRVDSTTLDIISDIHETGFLFGGCPNNAQHPSNPYFISRVQGDAVRGTKEIIDMAERFNQLAVIAYHVIGEGYESFPNATSMSVFKRVVNYVEQKNVDVITPSQLIDGQNW